MKKLFLKIVFIFGLSLSLQIIAEEEQTWKINLKEADIRAFITQVADITEKSFVIDPRVKGKVTVISHSSLTKDEVYQLFLTVLHINNFTAVPGADGLLKIVPSNTATKDTIRFDSNSKIKGEELITRVIPVKNSSASELINVLRPMVAQHGHFAAVPSANSIIISDHAANIEKIIAIINEIDGAESEEIEVVQLKEAWVTDIVTLLESLTPVETGTVKTKASSDASSRVRVVADERTNRLILKGEKSARARVVALVEKLDTPGDKASGATQVIYLRFAEAKKVAEILTSLVSKNATGGATSASRTSKGTKSAEDLVTVPTYIQADESLNALVVKADPASMEEVHDLVRKLDVRRAQVLIEAAVIEVKGDVGKALGVQWGFGGDGSSAPVGGVSFSNLGNSLNDLGAAAIAQSSGLGALTSPPALNDGLSLVGGKFNSDGKFEFGAFLQAISTTSNTNILSTPSIVTLDNEEAEIIVGQEVPIVTGTTTSSTGGLANPFTTTQRKDVGLTLKVIPHIHEGDLIRLEIDQQSSGLSTSARDVEAGANTITTKRSIKTTILAADQEFIVLGGLVQEDDSEKTSKVPLLGDIPFIGFLFRSTQIEREKTNLMVFLKPTILRDSLNTNHLSQGKYQKVRELQLEIDRKSGAISLYKKHVLPVDIQQVWSESLPKPLPILQKEDGKADAVSKIDSDADNLAMEKIPQAQEADHSGETGQLVDVESNDVQVDASLDTNEGVSVKE